MTTAETPDRRRHFPLIAAGFTALLLPAHGKEGDSGVPRALTPAGATRVVQAHVRSLFEGRIEKMVRNYHHRLRLMPGHDMLRAGHGIVPVDARDEGRVVDSAQLIAALKKMFGDRPLVPPQHLEKLLKMYAFEILETKPGPFATDPVKTPDGKLHFMIKDGDILFKVGPAKPRKGDFLLFQLRPLEGSWKVVTEYLD